MATKKSAKEMKGTTKTTLIKVAEAVGTLAGEISVRKDRFKSMASDAIDSVKSTIQDITIGKKTPSLKKAAISSIPPQKATTVKVVKKAGAIKKSAKSAVKKATGKPVKAAIKAVKSAAKKTASAKNIVAKKVAAVKNTTPTKKIAVKKVSIGKKSASPKKGTKSVASKSTKK